MTEERKHQMQSVIGGRVRRPVSRGLVVGLVVACAVLAALVVKATADLGGQETETDRVVSTGLLGLDMVQIQQRRLGERSETSLRLRPGVTVLLVLPVAGVGTGLVLRRRERGA